MNAGVNLFGPGNRANATIGRTIRLTLMNVFKIVPGIADKSTQGNPGKYSFCIAERADRNPWPPLCEEFGYPDGVSTVTVFAGAGFCNVENHGGNTPGSDPRYDGERDGELRLHQYGPERGRALAGTCRNRRPTRAGRRRRCGEYLFEHAKHPRASIQRLGKLDRGYDRQGREDCHRGRWTARTS